MLSYYRAEGCPNGVRHTLLTMLEHGISLRIERTKEDSMTTTTAFSVDNEARLDEACEAFRKALAKRSVNDKVTAPGRRWIKKGQTLYIVVNA